MWAFLGRQLRIFGIGFLIAFVVTLFVLVDKSDFFISLGAGGTGGILLAIVIHLLERRFPEQPIPPDRSE